jgi:hypothetical protein
MCANVLAILGEDIFERFFTCAKSGVCGVNFVKDFIINVLR